MRIFPFRNSVAFRVALMAVVWLVAITVSHLFLSRESKSQHRVLMGYMPVVSNLASPLVDFITEGDDLYFEARKFPSFSEIGEAFRSGHIQVAFLIAPLAAVLFEQGVPLKIVYIGNRHESTLVVQASGKFDRASDLVGKTIAVPIRYSGHFLALKRYLREHGMRQSDVHIVEIPPPEMPSALATAEIDGYFVGEPFASKAIENGTGKRFLDGESIWPNFICNLMIVRQELLNSHPEWVEHLVTMAAMSGLWARDHVDGAVELASRYWGQERVFLRYLFSNPPNRYRFDLYTPRVDEMDEILQEMYREGLITRKLDARELVEDRFAKAVAENPINPLHERFSFKLERERGSQVQAAK